LILVGVVQKVNAQLTLLLYHDFKIIILSE